MRMYAEKSNHQIYFELLFGNCIQPNIFALMTDEKEDKGVISVRPPEGSDLKEKLQKLADDTERSMNFHAVKAIEQYLVKNKLKPVK